MSGSVGTCMQQGVHVKISAGLACLRKSALVPNEPRY